MKISFPLILTGSMAFIFLGFYISTTIDLHAIKISSEASDARQFTVDDGGGSLNEMTSIIRELSSLKSELGALKQLSPKIQYLTQEMSALKVKLDKINKLSNHHNEDNYSVGNDLIKSAEMKPPMINQEQQDKEFERIDIIKNAFQAEQTDTQWSMEITDSITSFFNSTNASGSVLSQVNCRTTLCIVEVEYENTSAMDEFDLDFQLHMASQLPQSNYATEQNDDGSLTVTMYMAREGYEFPQVE
ncbi:MAG: hypothetical protein K0U68_05635 [Gammaproteobacteria bacterium]|nr:hypothetical protein [Gammaproteobacteria bacterium]